MTAGVSSADLSDAEWARELVARLSPLFGLAVALTGSPAAAEDLVQAAALRLPGKRRAVTSSLSGYLRQTLINLHTDSLRRMRLVRQRTQSDGGAENQLVDRTGEVTARVDLTRALAQLAPQIRTVLVLRFLEDMTAEQVGLVMGRPAGTIRRWTHEGLQLLRKAEILADYKTKGRNDDSARG